MSKRLEKFATLFLMEQGFDGNGRLIHEVDSAQDSFEKKDVVPAGLAKN